MVRTKNREPRRNRRYKTRKTRKSRKLSGGGAAVDIVGFIKKIQSKLNSISKKRNFEAIKTEIQEGIKKIYGYESSEKYSQKVFPIIEVLNYIKSNNVQPAEPAEPSESAEPESAEPAGSAGPESAGPTNLRDELNKLKRSELKKRAIDAGLTKEEEDGIDDTIPEENIKNKLIDKSNIRENCRANSLSVNCD